MSNLRIAIDAMGGDFAPREVIAGTMEAVREYPHISKFLLFGDEAAVRAELGKYGEVPASVEVRHCTEVVGMEEAPAIAIRRKRDSSIARGVEAVKNGEAEAFFSAGNTGAMVAASTLKLRTLEGIERPAIATVMPTQKKPFVLIDAGGNTDCSSHLLAQFAVMGSVYSREILGQANPTIGLLSVGTEDSKGNETTKEAFQLLQKSHLNFKGNVEGHDLFEGAVDVVVCDGFVGNVVLKTSESVAHAISHWIKEEVRRNPIYILGALLMKGVFKSLKRRSDPSAYGGAPLLGVNGVCIIGHGVSNAFAVKNGIRVAAEAVAHQVNHYIVEEIKKLDASL